MTAPAPAPAPPAPGDSTTAATAPELDLTGISEQQLAQIMEKLGMANAERKLAGENQKKGKRIKELEAQMATALKRLKVSSFDEIESVDDDDPTAATGVKDSNSDDDSIPTEEEVRGALAHFEGVEAQLNRAKKEGLIADIALGLRTWSPMLSKLFLSSAVTEKDGQLVVTVNGETVPFDRASAEAILPPELRASGGTMGSGSKSPRPINLKIGGDPLEKALLSQSEYEKQRKSGNPAQDPNRLVR